jgi:hypothetical protein
VERSSGVNAKLLKRRQHIEELNRVQGLLVKLQVGGHVGALFGVDCSLRVQDADWSALLQAVAAKDAFHVACCQQEAKTKLY